ncbi:hypothetical protein [Nocardioides flavescens]|uniref:Uncharacterized protein n=1 Tax=Nocardioides flavescens TaxID=2691959 RepID=A0A6L7F382_9ACTN|nr:hypothetical protein [Nocardioides flavescens]MXG91374.1 hypothetical protein [Nocardioides flavescens]
MSESPDSPLDAEQESAVRRELAAARHRDPIPDDVAARLDDVLASLSREDRDDLASRRRRRNATRLLLAAAAVVVAGVGIGQVLPGSSGSSDSSASLSERTDPDRAGADSGGSAADSSGGGSSLGDSSLAAPEAAPALPLQLTSAGLAEELRAALLPVPGADFPDPGEAAPSASADELRSEAPGFTCTDPPSTAGRLLPAYVDGAPAVVSLTAGDDGERLVDVVDCATGETLRSVDLDAP